MAAMTHAPVVLPRRAWGEVSAPKRALLVHGLGSNAALMWLYGTALAEDGWYAEAVDLRGHGDAPRAADYSIPAYAADLVNTIENAPWDLVIGHSLGGAAATHASANNVTFTNRLILVDPAIRLAGRDRDIIRASAERSFADTTLEGVREQYPHWHDNDIELKAQSAIEASRWGVFQTLEQNPEWDVSAEAIRLSVPTHVIASDPKVYSIFREDLAADVMVNANITRSIVSGAGHSPHRDKPAETIAALHDALAQRSLTKEHNDLD